MKKLYKILTPVLTLALAFCLPFMVKAQNGNVTNVSAAFSGNNLVISGQATGCSSVAVFVLDASGTNVLNVGSTVVNNGAFSRTVSIANGGYMVKVADYEGGSFKTTIVGDIAPTGVTLNKTSATLNPKQTLQLSATVAPAYATNKNVTWSTSNKSVATVDSKGKVTAKAGGTAKITVKTVSGGKSATCTIKVRDITLNDNKVTIQKGKTNKSITVKAVNDKIDKVTTKNKKVATVKLNKGKLEIKGVEKGKTTITVKTKGGYSKTIEVNVQKGKVKTTKLSLSKSKITVKKGNKATVTATATPDKVSTGEKISISKNSDKKIATAKIDANGKITVTAKKKGNCKITVKAGNKTQVLKVKVK